MNESNVNAIRSALLFMAEKYRLIVLLAERFDDGEIIDMATEHERNARRIALTVVSEGITTAPDAALASTALAALIDAMNRQMQSLGNKGLVSDAQVVEARIREVYAAAAALDVIQRGLSMETPAQAAA